VGPRFRYCFFPPTPRGVKLASRYRVRRQLRPLGISPKSDDMPVIRKTSSWRWYGQRLVLSKAFLKNRRITTTKMMVLAMTMDVAA
ncbi:MAG: hypothetical protein VB127_03065, partial [Sphaerochaeta sp.]|nr:hypothetical protein [Sphaerochaeta sp.]